MSERRLIDAVKLKQYYAWWDEGGDYSKEQKKLFDFIVDAQPTVHIDEEDNSDSD